MRFTELNLCAPLQKAIGALGYEETTPIQTQAIPPGLQSRDIVGCAQTGTGKTLAFLLPALEIMLQDQTKTRNPRVVILEPTRELVIQVAGEARKLAARTSLRVVPVYGGAGMGQQIDKLRQGADVVVATPGRLMDHMRRKNVDFADVKMLVLDEADRMLDMGFLPDIKHIVGRMPRQRQTMLFSATIPPAISALARQFQRDPLHIEIDLARPPEAIQQALYPVPKHLKLQLLLAILEQIQVSSMLLFTRTKQEADIVARQLGQARISVACIHGDFKQRERISALEGFRSGQHRVLVATNIAARGLDVEGISHVVNYDVPDQPEDYIHRIGRTARAEAAGDAITLVTPDDEALIYRIEYLLGHKIARQTLPGFNYDAPTPSWARLLLAANHRALDRRAHALVGQTLGQGVDAAGRPIAKPGRPLASDGVAAASGALVRAATCAESTSHSESRLSTLVIALENNLLHRPEIQQKSPAGKRYAVRLHRKDACATPFSHCRPRTHVARL